jgi:hypothetical protein
MAVSIAHWRRGRERERESESERAERERERARARERKVEPPLISTSMLPEIARYVQTPGSLECQLQKEE